MFQQAKWACAYYFLCPGIVYGMLTARMPAVKLQAGINEAQIGLVLLTMGASALVSLALSAKLVRRFTSAVCLKWSSLVLLAAMAVACTAGNLPTLLASIVAVGFSMGVLDIAMNSQAVEIESHFLKNCMSFVHGFYSLGVVCASVICAVMAQIGASVFVNAVVLFALYLIPRVWANHHLLSARPMLHEDESSGAKKALVPLFILLCGVMTMFTNVTEGAIAEWGSLLLHTVKGAPESVAALCYGVFSIMTVTGRMFADSLRETVGDALLIFLGAALGLAGLTCVLYAPSVTWTLAGCGVMGLAMSPIIPIIFSRAGSYPGIDTQRAISIVSVLSYGGLLTFPPVIGWLAHSVGLTQAMSVTMGLLGVLIVASMAFRKR